MVDDPADAGGHVVVVAAAARVQGLGHHELGPGRHRGHALAVVGHGRGYAAHVGSVTLVVLARALALGGVAARADAGHGGRDLAGEILVAQVDAGVDHADAHAGAGADRPRPRRADDGGVSGE